VIDLTASFSTLPLGDWYIITETTYENTFDGTTAQAGDMTWTLTNPGGAELSQNDTLLITGAGKQWSEIHNELVDKSIDITNNPIVTFRAKAVDTDATVDTANYAIALEDVSDGYTYAQFKIKVPHDETWHDYSIDVSESWADLNSINKIVFDYRDGSHNVFDFYIDDLAIGKSLLSEAEYTLTTEAGTGGSISPASGTYSGTVQIEATADDGYFFSGWTGDIDGATNPKNLYMDADKSVTANFDVLEEIDSTSTAPTIDGTKDAAYTASNISIDNVSDGTVTDDTDLSGTWTALWDADSLYIYVDVTDDALSSDGGSWWHNDGVELYIDADNSKGSSYGDYEFQVAFIWNDNVYETKSTGNGDLTDDINYAMVSKTGGYILEASLPWDSLGMSSLQSGNDIGFEISLIDDDDGGDREGKKTCFGTSDNAWESPANFGVVELGEGTATTQYTLTTTATNGDITLDPSGGEYDADTDVDATANADDGYEFVDWEGAATGSTNPVTITMDAEKSLTANFTAILVSSVTIDEGATLSLTVDGDDDTLSVNILPGDALNKTVNWSSEDEDIATVTSAGIVSAVAAGTVDVIATAADGGGAADTISVTVTDAPVGESLTAAFAFGANDYTTETPNEAGTDYVKVVQNGANFTYSASQGHGYTETGDIDGSVNNRNSSACGEELYDQFIGVKHGGDITFRVDVPNGDYQFVAVMGDARYGHTNTLQVRDGSSGSSITLIDEVSCSADEYATVKFGDKSIIPCSGATFTAQPESPVLTVTNGYIDVIQSTPNTGGDLVLVEIWNVDDNATPTQESMTFVQSASYDMEGASLQSTWGSGNNYGTVTEFNLNGNYSHFLLGCDISSIPSDATIDTVELTVYNSATLYGGRSVSSEVRAITASFDEDVVTYDNFSSNIDGTTSGLLGTLALTAPGGDPQTDAEIVVESSSNFVSAAQSALDGDGFFGLAVLDDPNQSLKYHSDDATTEGYRPEIRIVYTTNKDAEASFESIAGKASMLVYPNPAANGQGINIELKGFEYETNATISIIDISGRIAYSTNVKTHGHASQRMGISTDGLSAGMYMVVVRSDNKMINQKLIIK
jgi:hypothetical protein